LKEKRHLNNKPSLTKDGDAIANDKKIFTVYPNPAKETINIQSNGKSQFILSDQSGKIILAKTIENNGSINIEQLATG
jgi:hypothetical protein